MNKTAKIIIASLAILAVVFVGYLVSKNTGNQPLAEPTKVGAILPLSGPAAVIGEPLRNGLELALKDKSSVEVIYEDSQAMPALGIAAYQKLMTQDVDAVVSAYSGVSTPLTALAVQNKTPLIMTVVAADNVTNEYSYRYYAKPNSYVEPAFTDANSPLENITDIAILYRNDEFGKSVSDILNSEAVKRGKNVVISEGYQVNETDFSTALLKIQNTKPQAVIFISGTPAEALSIVKKAFELKLESVFIEASASLSEPAIQKQAPKMTYYTTGFKFSLPDESVDFKGRYEDTYGATPSFAAAFGYDIGRLIADCADRDIDMQICLSKKTNVKGITGSINEILDNEINPPMILMKIN